MINGYTGCTAHMTATELADALRPVGSAASAERGSVLIEAHKTINGERQDVYGSPEDSFKLIAKYWNVYLKSRPRDTALPSGFQETDLEKSDVAMMMTLFKIARLANGPQHRDGYVDACGYLGIASDMQEDA